MRGIERLDWVSGLTVAGNLMMAALVIPAALLGGGLGGTLTAQALAALLTLIVAARLLAKVRLPPARATRAMGRTLMKLGGSFVLFNIVLALQPYVDAVVLSRILYLMSDWRTVLREAVRVLAPGGRLLHEWGNGSPDEEWVQIRERARALFEQEGIRDPFHPGVRSEEEVDRCLAEHGLAVVSQVPLGPGPSIPLSDFLQKIDEGDCSYVWSVPVAIQQRCLPELRAWAAERFDLEQPIPFPREIRWTIFRR